MTGRPEAPPQPVAPARPDDPTRIFDGAFRLVVVLAAVMAALMVVRVLADSGAPAGGAGTAGRSPAADNASFLLPDRRPAPALDLTGPDGEPVSLAAMRGGPVLVFFGYTHCPDVCPATIGRVGAAIDAAAVGARAIFVSVDPERDTVPWLAEFVRYMPAGFTAVTGTPGAIRTTADAWGVRYARVGATGDPAYSMSHTADVFLIDGRGQLRATFPFGTEASSMTAVLRLVAAKPDVPSAPPIAASAAPSASSAPSSLPPSPAPIASPGASAVPADSIWPQIVSSSIWAGRASPVVLALFDDTGARLDDATARVSVEVQDQAGTAVGPAVPATAVRPSGVPELSFVPTVDIPSPGRWRLAVEATSADGAVQRGVVDLTALDPGGSAALGAPAPSIRTPTPEDFGGDLSWVTTDPLPDPRLTQTSTADALAAGTPFVLVVDSARFKVTPACGKALGIAKFMVDRWTTTPFIHLEPYRYTVVTSEPVLEGSLADPVLTDAAQAWGVGAAPWGVGSMPWVFIVDGAGTVRAKYQGVIGTTDLDVILALLAQEG